jgi:ribonucleoside-triphosphate reductase
MDGDPLKNLTAFESVVRAMHDNNMNYFAINHPVDRCPSCGNTTIIDGDTCPVCGYKETYNKQTEKVKLSDILKK